MNSYGEHIALSRNDILWSELDGLDVELRSARVEVSVPRNHW